MSAKAKHPVDSAETQARKDHDNFMMDFENYALQRYAKKTPTGLERYKVNDWAVHMKDVLVDSDTTWSAYVSWVQSGGGDEWFQEDSKIESSTLYPIESSTRCSGCGRGDDFCRCGTEGTFWG